MSMEQVIVPTLTHKKSDMGKPMQHSPATFRHRRRRSQRKRRTSDDEKAQVETKIMALQRIVPGGESLSVDKLFEQTAEYIMALQNQLKAMRLLTTFFEGLDKENTKCGA